MSLVVSISGVGWIGVGNIFEPPAGKLDGVNRKGGLNCGSCGSREENLPGEAGWQAMAKDRKIRVTWTGACCLQTFHKNLAVFLQHAFSVYLRTIVKTSPLSTNEGLQVGFRYMTGVERTVRYGQAFSKPGVISVVTTIACYIRPYPAEN